MFQQQSQRYQPAARWLERGLVLAEVLGEECTDWATLRSPNLGPVGTRMRQMPTRRSARGFGTTYGGGASDMVTTPLTTNSNLRTYIAAVYVNGGGGGSLGRLFDKTSTSEYWYIDGTDGSMGYARTYSTVGAWASQTSSIGVARYVLAVSHDSSSTLNQAVLYINGMPVTVVDISTPSGTRVDNSDPLIIGNRTSDSARNFDGLIDRFYAFDSILSAQEIAFLSADMDRLWAPRRPFIGYAPSSGTPTAPTFIQEAETTVWNTTTSPKGSGNFTTQTGDVVVAVSVKENDQGDLSQTGTNVTLAVQQTLDVTSYCEVEVSAGVVASGGTTSVSFASTLARLFGGNALTFRGSDGIGASAKTNVDGGAPSLNITTTQDNSAIVVAVGDWNAIDGASRTWRTVNGYTPTSGNGQEITYFRDSASYTVYVAYYPDAGAIGAKTVGLSAPAATPRYSIVALEVKGTASVGGGASILQQMMAYHH